jgi:hypothetical protein
MSEEIKTEEPEDSAHCAIRADDVEAFVRETVSNLRSVIEEVERVERRMWEHAKELLGYDPLDKV